MSRRANSRNEEAKRLAREREMERDTIYYLDFIPKDGRPTGRTTLLNDPWCVRLFKKPEGDQEAILYAIQIFEERHGVKSWDEIASRYTVGSLYYP